MTDDTNPNASVQSVELYQFEGADVWQEGDENARLRAYFPLSPGTPNASEVGAVDLTMVCIELEPGNHLPTHRDSNEELLVVTGGTVEASVDEETVELSTGECVVVPEMAPHGMRNVGDETAHVLGVFPNDELTATFEAPLEPFGTAEITVASNPEETADH